MLTSFSSAIIANEGEARMRTLGILIGSALTLSACATTPRVPVDPNNPLFAPGYMAQAASADQAEIQSGQMALQASQNAGVRNFANMIIADHTRSSQMIASAAAAAHLPPPAPTILPAQQAMLDQLHAAGVLGPPDGSKPREILKGLEELDDIAPRP